MMWLRKAFMCWWGGCGKVQGEFWRCHHCGKFARYPWEDAETRHRRLSSSD